MYTFDMYIYTTYPLKLAIDQIEKKREWLFLVIDTFHMHTYQLKFGMDSNKFVSSLILMQVSHLPPKVQIEMNQR